MSNLLKREDVIHFAIRKYLRKQGWILVAGEYPNGSDDELHSLRIMDPVFAKDDSPDHRRHSINKLIPDLVIYKDSEFLIIEIKPRFDKGDEEKLKELLFDRSEDLKVYLSEFVERYLPRENIDVSDSKLTPCLGFAKGDYTVTKGFTYILVDSMDSIIMERK